MTDGDGPVFPTAKSFLSEVIMAKGQKRSNKEIKKPKKNKSEAAPPVVEFKGISANDEPPKKKKG